MANLTENTQNPAWSAGVYQIETSDPVLGGANGIANRQAKELAARTQWLRTELSKAISSIAANKSSSDSAIALKANHATQFTAGAGLTGGGDLSANRAIGLATPSTLSGSTTNWVGNGVTGHTHEIAKATPTVAGVVKLVNALNSTATDAALTALQGKNLAEQIASAVSGSLNLKGSLAAQNLNDLHSEANYGVWQNNANANATTERNYPSNRAGTLLVLPSAYKGQQVYFPFDEKGIYIRDTRNHAATPTWGDWYKIGAAEHTLTSTNTTSPLSAAMGKKLNDEKVAKSGDDMTGHLNIRAGSYSSVRLHNDAERETRLETVPNSVNDVVFQLADRTGGTGSFTAYRFRKAVSGTKWVAYEDWVEQKIQEAKPNNFSGIDLDSATAPQFFINAKTGYVAAAGGEHAGLILGYQNDCSQIIAAGGNLWVRGSDHNPISDPSHWSAWKRILDENNGVMLSGNQTINGTKTFSGALNANGGIQISGTDAGYFEIKRGTSDFYLRNRISGKFVQFKDDGVLTYNGNVEVAGSLSNQGEIHAGGVIANSYRNDWVGYQAKQPTEGKNGFFDVLVNNVVRGGMQVTAEGGGKYATKLLVTPSGATNTDRRVVGMAVMDTAIHTQAYGLLHEYFATKAEMNTKSTVAVLTGKIAHGGTIPLPAGFSQAQCKWMVSMHNDNPTSQTWDIQESGAYNHYNATVWTDANRVVHCRVYKHGHSVSASGWQNAEANYMIIGVK